LDLEELDSVEATAADKTDREIMLEIHAFMSNINDTLQHVMPALDGLAASPMGKMLGLKK
jgi:hypothetical protein